MKTSRISAQTTRKLVAILALPRIRDMQKRRQSVAEWVARERLIRQLENQAITGHEPQACGSGDD